MRCFTPVDVKHRGRLWGALAPSALDGLDFAAGRWHRQLVCGLVTLFAQVTRNRNARFNESETLGLHRNEVLRLTKSHAQFMEIYRSGLTARSAAKRSVVRKRS